MSDDARRIAELEDQLRQTRAELDRYRSYLRDLSRDIPPGLDDDVPTEEEGERLLATSPGTPLTDVIAELRRELPCPRPTARTG